MAKNIAFFSDGTWNGPGQDENADGVPDITNVLKLYNEVEGNVALSTLRLQDEQEKELLDPDNVPIQVAKYIHGVGDSRNYLTKMLGGVFGGGIIQRIVRGYTYISRNYQAGDSIYLIGFSRGAYTSRAIGGLIARVGLLDASKLDLADREAAYRYGLAAWVLYRRGGRNVAPFFGFLDRLQAQLARPIDENALIRDVPIRAIGVWDTVGSLGIPLYAVDAGRLDLFRFADNDLSPKVANGFHALAIDERRVDFTPTRWNPRDGVWERWFIGAHADVGGGYPEAGLSDIALQWMKNQLSEAGLRFNVPTKTVVRPDPTQDIHTPWDDPIWLFEEQRRIDAKDHLDESVKQRLALGCNGYPCVALQPWLAANPLDPNAA